MLKMLHWRHSRYSGCDSVLPAVTFAAALPSPVFGLLCNDVSAISVLHFVGWSAAHLKSMLGDYKYREVYVFNEMQNQMAEGTEDFMSKPGLFAPLWCASCVWAAAAQLPAL